MDGEESEWNRRYVLLRGCVEIQADPWPASIRISLTLVNVYGSGIPEKHDPNIAEIALAIGYEPGGSFSGYN